MQAIIPYCIYYLHKPKEDIYLASMGWSELVKDLKGEFKLVCSTYAQWGAWKLGKTFYSLLPTFRPIPHGMVLFEIENNPGYPYNITSVHPMFDPFNVKDENDYMIAYNTPVPNTVPLYLHKRYDNVYPSFDPEPPSKGWSQEELSPIFVMKENYTKFICENGRCMPSLDQGQDFIDCFVACNMGTPHQDLKALKPHFQQSKIYIPVIVSITILIIGILVWWLKRR